MLVKENRILLFLGCDKKYRKRLITLGKDLFDSIENFDKIRNLYISVERPIKKVYRKYLKDVVRVEKIADMFFSGEEIVGKVVKVEGFLSRYGYCFTPRTYIPFIPGKGHQIELGRRYNAETKSLQIKYQQIIPKRRFHFPSQILPSLKPENANPFVVSFLYPSELCSFLFPKNKENMGNKKNSTLDITPSHRGIPVLMSENDALNLNGKNVKVIGIISRLPEILEHTFSAKLCELRKSLYNNFMRPYSERGSFCLDCRDPDNFDCQTLSMLPSLKGVLYIESHLDNLPSDPQIDSLIKLSVPKVLNLSEGCSNRPDLDMYVLESDVSVIRDKGNVFGFYIETDFMDQNIYANSLDQLHRIYDGFRKVSMNNIRSAIGMECKLKPDFLFDFQKQKIFHPEGVLRSKEIEKVLERNESFKSTVDWLRLE